MPYFKILIFALSLFWSSCLPQRKPEEETGSTGAQDTDAAPVKKARQEEDPPAAPDITENGHVPNGGVTSTEQNQNCYHIL